MKFIKNLKKLTVWRGHSARLWRASRAQYLIPRVYAIPISRERVTRDKKQLRRSCYHGARAWCGSGCPSAPGPHREPARLAGQPGDLVPGGRLHRREHAERVPAFSFGSFWFGSFRSGIIFISDRHGGPPWCPGSHVRTGAGLDPVRPSPPVRISAPGTGRPAILP